MAANESKVVSFLQIAYLLLLFLQDTWFYPPTGLAWRTKKKIKIKIIIIIIIKG